MGFSKNLAILTIIDIISIRIPNLQSKMSLIKFITSAQWFIFSLAIIVLRLNTFEIAREAYRLSRKMYVFHQLHTGLPRNALKTA